MVMHNVYASKNRRKIEKGTLTNVSPRGPWEAPTEALRGARGKITLRKLPDEVFMQKECGSGEKNPLV